MANMVLSTPAFAQSSDDSAGEGDESSGETEGKVGSGLRGSGLPLPRFVSLRTGKVNMRSGPGVQYPILWTYHRRELPVEVIAEFEVWRQIRDSEGAEGWVHQSMLAGKRTVAVRNTLQKVMLRKTGSDATGAVAWLGPNVIGKVLKCPQSGLYCQIDVEGYHGWLRRDEVWGVTASETID